MRIALAIAFSATFLFSFGQYTPEPLEMPESRNNIGVNLTPGLVVFMGGLPFRTKYSVIYKRQYAVSSKWRLTLNREIISLKEEQLSEGSVTQFSDSSITYRMDDSFHHSYDVRIGLEWFKPRKTSMVYGFDLIVGLLNESDGFRTRSFDITDQGVVPSALYANEEYTQDVQFLLVGFDFSIGQSFNASDKLNFVIRWTPEFMYAIPIAENYTDITQRETVPDAGLRFHLRGIEVYAHYIF